MILPKQELGRVALATEPEQRRVAMCTEQQPVPSPPSPPNVAGESPGISPSEERRRTGQYVVVGVIIVTSLIGLYHACVQQNAMLAGFIAPAIIMLLYLMWVLHTARRGKGKGKGKDSHQHHQHQHRRRRLEVPEVVVKEPSPATEVATVHNPTIYAKGLK